MSVKSILFIACIFALNIQLTYSQSLASSDFNHGFSFMPNSEAKLPILKSPSFLQDGKGLLFTWENVILDVQANASIEYQIKFYEKSSVESIKTVLNRKVLFQATTPETQFRYDLDKSALVAGHDYLVVVDTRIIYPEKTEVLSGEPNALTFTYIPECLPPSNIEVSGIGTNNFTVSWKGIPASEGGYRYELRYRIQGKSTESWTPINITKGNTVDLEGLTPKTTYEVEIRRICPPIREIPEMYSEWSSVKDIKLPAEKSISLPPFNCGDPFTVPTCNGVLAREGSFDTIYIGGFPIEVSNISSNGTTWSGTGYAPLPFGDNVVKVEWTGLEIDTNGMVCSGTVKGVSDDPAYYPNLDPGPIAFGGEICILPPSTPGFDTNGIHSVTGLPWDEYGFGPDGTYDKEPPYPGYHAGGPIDTTGTYDPWGFDANGNHYLTGDNQNPDGCTQEQMNSLLLTPPAYQPPPCNVLPPPYEWLDTTGTPGTAAGGELANQVADSLEYWLGQVLDELESFYQDSIDIQSTACDGIRTTMNSELTTLGYERKFILGPNDEYFNEGMYKHFSQRPKPMATNMDRNQTQKDFEGHHIELYDCDKKLAAYTAYLSIIDSLRNQGLSAFADELLNKIRQFSAEDAEYYNVHENLMQWLKEQSIDEIENEYDQSFGYVPGSNGENVNGLAVHENKANSGYPSPKFNGNFLADFSDGTLSQALFESFNTTPDDISFQFRQGWHEVNGLNRAYYLDAIAQRRLMGDAMPMLVTEHDSTLMPIIVKNRASDGRLYQVYLDSIIFTPSSAVMNAYLVLELPHNGQKLVFESYGLTFGPTGFPTLPVKLSLGNDVAVRLSNVARIILNGNSHTYVSIDCQGFAGIGLDADVELCRNIVIPIDSVSGDTLPDPNRVHGHLQVFIPSFSELFVNISMDPFVVTRVEDIKWNINNVVFDYSETVSDTLPNTPPSGYMSPFAGPNGFQPEWKGVYIKNLSATLPNHFAQAGQPLTVGVEKVIIDDCGFSGGIYASPLLSLANGNAGGWAFSVDTFEISIAHNTLVNAKFNGLINVPIFKNAGSDSSSVIEAPDCFLYKAFIEPGNIYNFVVLSEGNFRVDMWKAAQVALDSCSSISMQLKNGEFNVKANLSGSITIGANIGNGMSVNAPNITFQGVEVSNKAPYFSPGIWGFSSYGAEFGGFELTIDSLKMVESNGYPALRFRSKLILSSKVNLAAEGSFLIVGEKVEVNGRQRWKFKELKVNEICIDNASFPGVDELSGCINFYEDDPTYGSGFRGQVDVKFKQIGRVKAVAQFGKVSGDKYFFVDALYCVPENKQPPLQLGPVTIYGIGGGIYHHMNRDSSGAGLGSLCDEDVPIPSQIGSSISGIHYEPDMSKGLGLKLTLVFGVGSQSAFNANTTFEILFNAEDSTGSGGGLSDVWVYGNAKFMDQLNVQGGTARTPGSPPVAAKVSANVDLHMDFNAGVFTGQLEVFLNAGTIKGAGPNNRMAHAEIKFSPGEWYIKVGRPYMGSGADERAGIAVGVPGIGEIGNVMSYLQIGSNVDPMPPLPPNIAALTGLGQTSNVTGLASITGATDQRASTQAGFVFGAEINVGAHDKDFPPFSLTLAAQLGFDVSVLNYPGITCSNTNDELGINGWYANGQVYAGLDAELKIKVKVFKKQKTFTIFDLAAAVALQAGLPNPFWAKGGVGADYNLLGGLVKGHCDFQISIGEQCQASGGGAPFEDVPIIATTTPSSVTVETVFPDKQPYVNFNFPINQQFSISDFDGNSFNYIIRLDYAKVKLDSWQIPVDLAWTPDKKGLAIRPRIYLPRNDSFTLEIKVHVDSLGINIHEEERVVPFKTNGFNFGIPLNNIAGSYPLDGQYNFYKDELTDHQGYIQLIKGQPDQFYPQDGVQMLVRLKKSSGQCMTVPIQYDALKYQVNFPLPTNGFFVANGIYKLELIKVPTGSNGQSVNPCADLPPSNPSSTTSAQSAATPLGLGGGAPSNPPTNPPPSVVKLFTANFRVSQYNTFYDKMTAWDSVDHISGYFDFQATAGFEPFDKFELGLVEGKKPLVEITALTSQTNWFNNTTQIKALYSLEPSNDFFNISRDVSVLGWPARKAIYLKQEAAPSISSTNFNDGTVEVSTNLHPGVKYDVINVATQDYQSIIPQLSTSVNNLLPVINTAMQNEYGWSSPYNSPCAYFNQYAGSQGMYKLTEYVPLDILKCGCIYSIPPATGNFPVTFRYRLPGLGQYSSEKAVTLVKP